MTRWQKLQIYIIMAMFFVILTAIIVTLHLPTLWESVGGFFSGMMIAQAYILLNNDVINSIINDYEQQTSHPT